MGLPSAMADLHAPSDSVEPLSSGHEPGCLASHPLPAPNSGINVERIDLYAVADSTDTLRRHQRRSAAEEGIENQLAAFRAVQDRVSDQCDRLNRRMQGQQVALLATPTKSIHAWIVPNIGAI